MKQDSFQEEKEEKVIKMIKERVVLQELVEIPNKLTITVIQRKSLAQLRLSPYYIENEGGKN